MKRVITLILAVAIILPVYAKKNMYMIKGTDEYKNVTAKLISDWGVTSYIKGDDGEQIDNSYKSIVFSFKESEKDGDEGIATYIFTLKDSVAEERFADWKKKYEDITMESYAIKGELEWEVSKSGEILHLENATYTVDIKGTGKKLKNFVNYEQGLIESASAANNSGSLQGMIMGGVMKSASGTSGYFPSIPDQCNPIFEESKLELKTTSKNKFFLIKK